MKKTIALLLCLGLLLGSASTASAIGFDDVPEGSYYYEPVYNIAWEGIIGGFPDGSFRPASPITRAQMAVLLVNMKHLTPYEPSTPTFPDVPSTHWAYKYVEAAVKEGFIAGYPAENDKPSEFRPDRNVSYNEALTMIVAQMGYTLKGLGGTYPTAFTNKARDLGILNTCAMLGDAFATRANVSCFLRDALIAQSENQDRFKYKGDNYNISLGRDYSYRVEKGSSITEGYAIVVFIENTSASSIPYSSTSFMATIDGRDYLLDTASYGDLAAFTLPDGIIPAGQTVKADLLFACGMEMSSIIIKPNLSTGNEAEIELVTQ